MMKKQIAVIVLVLGFLLLGTAGVILYGKGYRFSLLKGKPEFAGTGLLVATSSPDGAEVFINGHLTTATDNTINLTPGEYDVKITKEGYFPWEKTITIQKEVVSKADALLFPTAPKLESITLTGVENPVLDPTQSRIAYTTASQSARKNGVYVLDMSSRPILTLQSSATQIADDTSDFFSQSSLIWSPDGKEMLASVSANANSTSYLLQSDSFNQTPQDVTATLPSVQARWQQDQAEKDQARLATLKPTLSGIITSNFNIISWAPDDTKILYVASQSGTLPIVIVPRLIGTDSTPETRTLKKDSVYIYDIKEDRNYPLDVHLNFSGGHPLPSDQLRWLPDSAHLVYVNDRKINIMEYDGGNSTTIYAGPFIDNYVFPWTAGSKIVILTNLGNPTIAPNLYTISLK